MWIKKLFPLFIIIYCGTLVHAQESWPSPELEQMYANVQQYEKRGNYADALITVKQLIALVPEKHLLKTELGKLYYLSGNYKQAISILQPLTKDNATKEDDYQLLAASLIAEKANKKAGKVIDQGLKKYPASGILYYQRGEMYMGLLETELALSSWQAGIEREPSLVINYREYAITALHLPEHRNYGALQHAEEYLTMRADTSGNDSIKSLLFDGWKNFLKSFADYCPAIQPPNGGKTMSKVYWELLPVVSDGITSENLTMLRTRFLIEWQRGKTRTEAIFKYQDELVKNGWFDIYNEWLFGKAEHAGQYEAWNKFHTGDMERFEQWRTTHLLQPAQVR